MTLGIDRRAAAIIVVGVIARSVYALVEHPPSGLGDQLTYLQIADHFKTWWSQPDAFRPPGYPFIVSLILHAGLGHAGIRIAQALAVGAASWLAAVVASMTANRGAGVAVAVLSLAFPPLITLSSPLLSDAFASACLATAVLLPIVAWQRTSYVTWTAAAATCLAVAALLRPNLLVVAPVVVLMPVLQARRRRQDIVRVALALALPFALLFGPWIARNEAVLGKAAPLGTNQIPFQIGVNLPIDRTAGRYGAYQRDLHYFGGSSGPPHVRTVNEIAGRAPVDVLVENLRERPASQFSASLFWLRELWLVPFDDHLLYGRPPVVPWPLLLGLHLAFLVLALGGLWILRRAIAGRVVLAATVLLTLPFAVLQSGPRLAMPAVLLLLVPAGAASARAASLLITARARRVT